MEVADVLCFWNLARGRPQRFYGRRKRLMSSVQFCLVAAAILGLNACAARGKIAATPPPATSASSVQQSAGTGEASPTSEPAREAETAPSVTTRAPEAAIQTAPPAAKTPAPIAQTPKSTAPTSGTPPPQSATQTVPPVAKTPTPTAQAPKPASPTSGTEAQQSATQTAPPVAKTPTPTAQAPKPTSPTSRTPAPQAETKAVPPVAKTPAPTAQAPKPASPPSAPAPLDLNALKEQLKETKAIGIFTKISLKNQVDDLLDQFRKYHQGKSKIDMMELRRSYNLLLMKVLSLVQNKDQKLASSIVSSREAIWALLSDPKKFATLEV